MLWYTLLYQRRSSAAASVRNSFSCPAISITSSTFEKKGVPEQVPLGNRVAFRCRRAMFGYEMYGAALHHRFKKSFKSSRGQDDQPHIRGLI